MDKQQSKGVGASSMLDLKAELLRKKEEFQREKALGPASRKSHVIKEKKANIWSRSNAGVRERAEKDLEAKREEDDILAKSRKMLEAKARAYEKLSSGNIMPDEEVNQRFLVDFERKAIDKFIEQKHKDENSSQTLKESDRLDFIHSETEKEEKPREQVNPEKEWVDYIDSLGRSRRCMKKDLPELKKMDRELTGKRTLAREADKTDGTLPELMSDDMYKERLRVQWEEEERRNMEQPESHYANVQFNEVRDHGVAFYQFDKDTEVRKQQMDKLAAFREKTKQNREAQRELKKKRKAMMAARLAKVRQRKLIREGKDPSEIMDLEESLDMSDSDDEELSDGLSRKSKDEQVTSERDDSWRKRAPIREWDQGKEGLDEFLTSRTTVLSEEAWKEKLRQERPVEFAPPSAYQDKKHLPTKTTHNVGPKLLFSKSKKLKAESDKTTTELNQDQNVCEQSKPVPVDVDKMVAKIRAEVEMGQSVPAESASVSGDSSLASEHVDLADIPLPPTTHMSFMTTTPLETGIQTSQGAYVEAATVQNSLGRQWNSETVLQSTNNSALSSEITNVCTSTQHTQPTVERLPAVIDGDTWASQPSSAGGSTITAPLVQEPQPAHYSSGPTKPQAPKPRYQRVNLHELPLELPAPPAANNIPEYPSQEEIFGNCKKRVETVGHKKEVTEDEAIRLWKRQFGSQSKSSTLKPDNVPFASSYIQSNTAEEATTDPAVNFDPSKPPPNLT